MSDGQTLFLVLSFLYLSECCIWIGKRTVAFVSPWCRRWRVSFASSLLGNVHGGLLILNPFPPLGKVFLSHLSPVSIAPSGVCAYNLQCLPDVDRPVQTGKTIAFENIIDADADGTYLVLNKTRFAKCATTEQAKTLADLIGKAIHESRDSREALIRKFMDRQFSKEEACVTLTGVSELVASTRRACNAFFVFLFWLVPILVYTYGLRYLFIPVAVAMVVFEIYISITYFHAHKAIYPSLDQDLISNVVKMILCPPVAVRAVDLLTANAVSRFHPILVATLFSSSESESFMRSFMRDLKHPLRHDLTDPQALDIATWHVELQLSNCIKFLDECGFPLIDSLFAAPTREGLCTFYCPRCECQFVATLNECPDCPGVELMEFPTQQTLGDNA